MGTLDRAGTGAGTGTFTGSSIAEQRRVVPFIENYRSTADHHPRMLHPRVIREVLRVARRPEDQIGPQPRGELAAVGAPESARGAGGAGPERLRGRQSTQ